MFKEAVEREAGILTEVDTYDGITFLPMSDGTGAYNRYFGRLNAGKMKIRDVMARKGDTPDYVNKMQQEVFDGCWRRLGQKWRLCSIGQEVARQDLKK